MCTCLFHFFSQGSENAVNSSLPLPPSLLPSNSASVSNLPFVIGEDQAHGKFLYFPVHMYSTICILSFPSHNVIILVNSEVAIETITILDIAESPISNSNSFYAQYYLYSVIPIS